MRCQSLKTGQVLIGLAHEGLHEGAPYAPAYGHPSHPGSVVVVKPHAEHQPILDYNTQDWELSGPGLGSEYIGSDIHRNAIANFKPHANDINDINAWGLGLPPGQSLNVGEYASSNNAVPNVVPPPNSGHKFQAGSPLRPVGPPNPYYRNKKATARDPEKEALIRAASLAAQAPASPVRDEIIRVSQAKLVETNRVKAETELVRQQQEILASQDPDTIAAERFYGALLEKIDTILSPMGASDVGCRERAVCAMYKDPFKHSPYSNLVSNELSKESSELVPPADSKMALRYYRYVQAARDGQEEKDCVTLYPHCNIDYNKKKHTRNNENPFDWCTLNQLDIDISGFGTELCSSQNKKGSHGECFQGLVEYIQNKPSETLQSLPKVFQSNAFVQIGQGDKVAQGKVKILVNNADGKIISDTSVDSVNPIHNAKKQEEIKSELDPAVVKMTTDSNAPECNDDVLVLR
ncbi:unnamed protein product, partial [Iphiclides podalirius]